MVATILSCELYFVWGLSEVDGEEAISRKFIIGVGKRSEKYSDGFIF